MLVQRAHEPKLGAGGEPEAAASPEESLKLWQQALADTPYADAHTIGRFRQHWQLLKDWNETTNLTAIVDEATAAWLHYRDGLEACPWLTGARVVDLGSGAGFPGLVLSIAMPHLEVTLVEPRRIRVDFLEMAVAKLGLKHVRVLRGKAGSEPPQAFDHAVTRATFSSTTFVPQALNWLQPQGSLICYRSPSAQAWGTRHAYMLERVGVATRARCLDILQASDWTKEADSVASD